MGDNFTIDFNDFQEKVLDEYGILKSVKGAENFDPDEMKDLKGSLWGCLFIPVFRIMFKSGKKTLAKVRVEKNYAEFEKYANALISRSGIKQAICNSLKNLNKNEILTEEEFVKLIVKTLTENDLRERFAVQPEPTLFAFIAYLIFDRGLEKYCAEI